MESISKYIDFVPKVICEVGVFSSSCIHSLSLMNDDTKMILVEPNPKCFKEIQEKFGNDKRFVLHEKAASNTRGTIKLYNRPDREKDASGFIEGLPACPAVVNDGYIIDDKDAIQIESILFSDIDSGDIDVLCVDTEGSEWFVLQNLVSRPKIITLETHGLRYINPFFKEIFLWMKENGYTVVGKDSSDTIFKKND